MITGEAFGVLAKTVEILEKGNDVKLENIENFDKKSLNLVFQNLASSKFYYFGKDDELEDDNQSRKGFKEDSIIMVKVTDG